MAWTQRVHDTFTDTNGTALASHTPDQGGSWSDIQAGCRCTSNSLDVSSDGDHVSLNTQSLADKQAAEFTVLNKNSFPGVLILCSWDGSNLSGYLAIFNVNQVEIHEYTGSGFTHNLIATGSATLNNGDVLRIDSDGAGNISGYVNGALKVTVADASSTSGLCGVYSFGGVSADDFFAYDDAGGGGGDGKPTYAYQQQ